MRPADEAEYVAFVDAAKAGLLRAGWLLTGDPTRAEDLVQEVLIKVYLHWGRISRGAETAWARKALVTTNIDQARRLARERLAAVPPERAERVADPEDTAYLLRMLATLSERERTIVVLRHYVGQSESEVAEALGVSLGTVKSTASRALSKLRAATTPEGAGHVR